jgi:hypothetical protein
MQQGRPEYLQCRCRAVESAGILVDAIGAQDPHLGPSIPSMVEAVLVGYVSTDSPDLRDYSHTMLANVAKALGEGFAPWLQRVVPLAVASCEQEDCTLGDGGSGDDSEADVDGGDDSSSDSEDGRGHFNVRTGESLGVALLQTDLRLLSCKTWFPSVRPNQLPDTHSTASVSLCLRCLTDSFPCCSLAAHLLPPHSSCRCDG